MNKQMAPPGAEIRILSTHTEYYPPHSIAPHPEFSQTTILR